MGDGAGSCFIVLDLAREADSMSITITLLEVMGLRVYGLGKFLGLVFRV